MINLTGSLIWLCNCSDTKKCALCLDNKIMSSYNINFAAMENGNSYVISTEQMDECFMTKKMMNILECSYLISDKLVSLSFNYQLLEEIRNMKTVPAELYDLVDFLRTKSMIYEYDLNTLANFIGVGICLGVQKGYFLDHDLKYGTDLLSLINSSFKKDLDDTNQYENLVSYVRYQLSNNVTMNWALRQYEEDLSLSVMQVLLKSRNSLDKLLFDCSNQSIRNIH